MPKPLVLLDVDGVINSFAGHTANADDRREYDYLESHGFPLYIHPTTVETVSRLSETCELMWCSEWGEKANDQIAPHLGLNPLPWIKPESEPANPEWKWESLRPIYEISQTQGRKIFWIASFVGSHFPYLKKRPWDHHLSGFMDTANYGYELKEIPDRMWEWLSSLG